MGVRQWARSNARCSLHCCEHPCFPFLSCPGCCHAGHHLSSTGHHLSSTGHHLSSTVPLSGCCTGAVKLCAAGRPCSTRASSPDMWLAGPAAQLSPRRGAPCDALASAWMACGHAHIPYSLAIHTYCMHTFRKYTHAMSTFHMYPFICTHTIYTGTIYTYVTHTFLPHMCRTHMRCAHTCHTNGLFPLAVLFKYCSDKSGSHVPGIELPCAR